MDSPKITATPQKLAEIEAKRKAAKVVPRDSSQAYKLICPLCTKPNTLAVTFCTGCGFGLCPEDAQPDSENVFWALVQGKDIGCVVLSRDAEIIVLEDKYPCSEHHIDVIPTRQIFDITNLKKEDIPMLQQLYSKGVEVLSKKIGKIDPDAIFAGFNHPVSIAHLHLHIIVPPFSHEKVLQYPRWHPLKKVVNDLTTHGTVQTYDKFPNQAAGDEEYARAMSIHKGVTRTPSKSLKRRRTLTPGETLNKDFQTWKKANKCSLTWKSCDETNFVIQFQFRGHNFSLKYPDPNDSEAIYFFEDTDGTLSEFCNLLNEFCFETNSTTPFSQILDKFQEHKKNYKRNR